MKDITDTPGYTGTAKFLHWLVLALLIVQFITAWTMPSIRRDTPVDTLISLHFSFGALILLVALVRLLWRMLHRKPAPEPGMPKWQMTSSEVIHWLLYVLLLVVPLLGWINASWRGMPVVMFGLPLPQLIATRAPGWQWTGDVHGFLADYVMLTVVGLHVAAALYHWIVVRDGVLQRMLPGR